MPIFLIEDEIQFPDPSLANRDGLLAIGGDLSPERLLLAYSNGIFPWYNEENPILWWSPDPRMVLFPDEFRVHKSLRQTLNSGHFKVSFDKMFRQVIIACAETPRGKQDGTWIIPEMVEAYTTLHKLGYAHSVEVTTGGRLAGGLYGVSLGGVFFGESMFYRERDASKVALYHLVERLKKWNFAVIDAQQKTHHLMRLGARTVSRPRFLEILESALKMETRTGPWE